MTTSTLKPQLLDFLKSKHVPEELYELANSKWHVLTQKRILLEGKSYTRGDEFTITPEMLASSVDRFGESLFTNFLNNEAQLAAWGEVRFATGPRPDDFIRLVPGSQAWKLAKQAAQNRAGRYPYGTELRAEAMARVEEQFGPGDTSTGGSSWTHTSTGGRS